MYTSLSLSIYIYIYIHTYIHTLDLDFVMSSVPLYPSLFGTCS